MQFVVFEKFASAYLFQIAREKSFDYLLIIYKWQFLYSVVYVTNGGNKLLQLYLMKIWHVNWSVKIESLSPRARWKTRGRGPRVPGYGVRGTGVRGPGMWKTRGVENTGSGGKHGVRGGKHGVSVENTGSKCKTQRKHYFAQQLSLNFVISNWNENQSAWNDFFGHKSELNILWERKPFKCQRAMQWFSTFFAWGVCFIFRGDLRRSSFYLKVHVTRKISHSKILSFKRLFKVE